MSFILDALRKSENERQREAAPDPARAPLAAARTGTPAWAWYAIGLLSVALAAAAVTLWQTGRSGTQEFPASQSEPAAQPDSLANRAPTADRPEPVPDSSSTIRIDSTETSEPLPIAELARVDPGLPEFSLAFVSFNSQDPSAGSAWINGRRYQSGERLAEGPEVLEIRQDSVVLAWRGASYLLRSR